ncbi:hypothetical protein DdX_06022 [Ditylenchus destructor]|uniref:Secreted protein n=1 Tax=Ditylenchus destructor TaxID=166010 RepID=A0AAD4NBN9_9BILA|nr:hypothetical protein DdX_06022 [Ditylenchus destructor]
MSIFVIVCCIYVSCSQNGTGEWEKKENGADKLVLLFCPFPSISPHFVVIQAAGFAICRNGPNPPEEETTYDPTLRPSTHDPPR